MSREKDCLTLLSTSLRQQSPYVSPRSQRPLPEAPPRQRPSRLLSPRRQILVYPSRRRPLPRPLPRIPIRIKMRYPQSKIRSYETGKLFHGSKSPLATYDIFLMLKNILSNLLELQIRTKFAFKLICYGDYKGTSL